MPVTREKTAKQIRGENAFELTSLFEFSSVVNASLDLKFIFNHFLLTLMGKFLSLKGVVLLENRTNTFRVEISKGIAESALREEWKMSKVPKKIIFVEKEDKKRFPWLKMFKSAGITMLIPLMSRDRIVGVAGLAPISLKNKLTEKEVLYLKSVANIAAVSIEKGLFIQELRSVNRQLDRKIQELNTLFEVGTEFNTVLNKESLIRLLIFSVMGQIGVNRYFLCVEEECGMKVVAEKLDGKYHPDVCEYAPRVVKPTLVEGMTARSEVKWRSRLEGMGIQVVIPLQIQNQTKGLLALGGKLNKDRYSQKDIEFLTSLGNLAMISLDNIRLFEQAIEKQRMEDELKIAREIQKGLLPAELPRIPMFDIAAENISSKQVGGDYYDVIRLSDHHFVVAIGDVSGKGTPASLLMASLQATIRALVPLGLSLSELTRRVNDLICDNTSGGRFITFFWGILDTESMLFRYVNAGHNPPMLIRPDSSVELLDKGGLILGITKTNISYAEGEVRLGRGDLILLYTDGVNESMNSQNVEFGDERLRTLAVSWRNCGAQTVLDNLVRSVKEHSTTAPQSDDITIVALKRV